MNDTTTELGEAFAKLLSSAQAIFEAEGRAIQATPVNFRDRIMLPGRAIDLAFERHPEVVKAALAEAGLPTTDALGQAMFAAWAQTEDIPHTVHMRQRYIAKYAFAAF